MKIKKYANERATNTLVQKLKSYKAASVGLTPQDGKTALAFAAGSLVSLIPFVSQAQCLSPAPNVSGNADFSFDANGDNIKDIKFTFTFNASYSIFNLKAQGVNGAKLFKGSLDTVLRFSNQFINDGPSFVAGVNRLCVNNGGQFCGVPGNIGIKLSNGKRGFIAVSIDPYANPPLISISITDAGVSDVANPAANTVKAGDCASLIIAVLPVELTHFAVKPLSDHVNLAWTTASEKDNAYFDIERSTDGVHFSAIQQVKGNGTTQSSHDYVFADYGVAAEALYYYRLKQVDNDGKSTYSMTLSAQMKDVTKIKVFPTVVKNQVNIVSSKDNLPTTLIDMTGRVLKTFSTTPQRIDMSDVGAGVYILRVGEQTARIIKSN